MIFEKYNLEKIELSNRIVMAPMTRTRSKNGILNDDNVEYYRQRASVGLIITEGTAISPTSMGYLNIPGLYNSAQTQSWKKVTDAVHYESGKIFTQLWHVGRVSHISNQPNYFQPLAPSAIRAENSFPWGIENGKEGRVAASMPRALLIEEIHETLYDYQTSAKNAMKAEFDGIEIHAANGYLLDQFLNSHTNIRKDQYGGNIENRCRFILEVVDIISAEIGASKVGIRFSPFGTSHDMSIYDEIQETFEYLAIQLSKRNIAYIHLNDQGSILKENFGFLRNFRQAYQGNLIFAGQLTKELASDLISKEIIDLAAFGRPLISNPDLVERFKFNHPLTEAKPELFYGSTSEGYTDYPNFN